MGNDVLAGKGRPLSPQNPFAASPYTYKAGATKEAYDQVVDKAEHDLQTSYPEVASRVQIFRHTRSYEQQLDDFIKKAGGDKPLTQDESQYLRERIGYSYDNYTNNRLQRDGSGAFTASTTDIDFRGQTLQLVIMPPPDFLPPDRHAGVLGHEIDHAIVHAEKGPSDKPLTSYERMQGERAAVAVEFAYQYAQNPTPQTANDLRALHTNDVARIISENPGQAAFMNNYALPAEAREKIIAATDEALAAGKTPSIALARNIGHTVADSYKPTPEQWAQSESDVRRLSEDYANSGMTREAFAARLSQYGETGTAISAALAAQNRSASSANASQLPAEEFRTTAREDFGRELGYISGVETNLGTTRALIGATEDGMVVLGVDSDNNEKTGVRGYDSFTFTDKAGTISTGSTPDIKKSSVVAEKTPEGQDFFEKASAITKAGHRNFADLDLDQIKAAARGLVTKGMTTDETLPPEETMAPPLDTPAPAPQQAAAKSR